MNNFNYVLVYFSWDRPPLRYFATKVVTGDGGLVEIWDSGGCLAEFNKNGWIHIDYVRG